VIARQTLAVACVALLAVTAGCGGLGGDRGTPTREPYEVEATATPTATATPVSDPGSPRASAAFLEAVANHTAALRRAGNFTIRRTARSGRVTGDADPVRVATVGTVDLDAGRYAFGRPADDGGPPVVEVYRNATARYRRVDGRLRNVTDRVDERTTTLPGIAARWAYTPPNESARFPLERNGTATVDGEEMARFTADDPGRFRGVYAELRTVTAFSATVLVDDRGIVRRFRYTIRGRDVANATRVESETIAITEVGTTTVPPLSSVLDRAGGRSATVRGAVANHTSVLRGVGNFTVRRVRRSGPVDGPSRTTERVVRLDLDAGRSRVRFRRGGDEGSATGVVYGNATGVYANRPGSEGFENVTGSGVALNPERSGLGLARRARDLAVEFPFEPAGTAAVDGDPVWRFVADDPGDFRGATADLWRVTAFRAVALVDGRGVVRELTYTVRGRTDDDREYVETVTIEVFDVGRTAVAPPEALANATDAGAGS
jgi:hypothetical protein